MSLSSRLSTHAEWVSAADRLLDALRPFTSPSGALIRVPGKASWSGERSDGLEGFARSFLLASMRIAGTEGESASGLLDRYHEGIIAGTTVDHADAWPTLVDRGQPLVEAASIALALHWTRPWLWNRLDDTTRQRIADWMAPSAQVDTPDNNWVLFPVIVQEFLASVGAPHSEGVIDSGLSRIDGWYDESGWYRDGPGQNYDYYNAWALHLYPLLSSMIRESRDPAGARERRARYRERLDRFLPQHLLFFGRNGSPILQGRSLSYRFAALAPLWLGQLVGSEAVPPGVVRHMAGRTLGYFLDAGVVDSDGVLTSGWGAEFRPMIQPYSGPTSPYWASKGFLGLLLPADSTSWTAGPSEPDHEHVDTIRAMSAPGFIVDRTGTDGVTRLLNHGSDNYPPLFGIDDPHYVRLAYSSHTAPTYEADPIDNHVGVIDTDGRVSHRARIERRPASTKVLASVHTPVWETPCDDDSIFRIATTSTSVQGHTVHIHVVTSTSPRIRTVHIGGWALASEEPPLESSRGPGVVSISDTAGLESRLQLVHTSGRAFVHRATGASPLGLHTAVPVAHIVHRGTRTVIAVVCSLGLSVDAERPEVIVEDDGTTVAASITVGSDVREIRAR
jgi:hypothetical protein